MKHLFLLLVLIFSNLFFSQSNITDSLKKFNYNELKEKFDDYYNNDKSLEAKRIAKYYLQKAKNEKNTLQIAEGYILIHFNEDFSTALKYIDSLGIITKNIKGSLYPARTYRLKGNLYYKNDDLKKALENYFISLNYAKQQNDEKQIMYVNLNIAYIDTYMGKNEEAAKIFKQYYNSKLLSKVENNQTRINLINCYIELNKLDSANILIKEGINISLPTKNKYNISQYSYLSGLSNLKQKKYELAISDLSKAYSYFSTIDDTNANYALYALGKSYDGQHDKEKAIQHFIKLDSNIQKTNNLFPELKEVYTYIINYYKEKDDKEKQLFYIDRFLKVNTKLDEQFKYLSTELHKKYEIPNLIHEKENIITDLKNRKITLWIFIGVILTSAFILITYFYFNLKKTEKKYRKIAQDLIKSLEEKEPIVSNSSNDVTKVSQPKTIIENKVGKSIPEDVIQFILRELDNFEKQDLFLKKGITLSSLSKQIKTNSSYLSDIINSYKGKNFATYLNDLRIDYAIDKLLKDRKFRSYKLTVVAEELGYNNEQAFATAFKKKTGTTFTIYIKEIENRNLP
ncbi:helix-turn-helix domain-containing protein [Elizabethkingia miricola]|uniref:Helix-turn-helix domain-containing protein n=1 Tax=Elizabethkingia miricola TaxID=172045 RepID=A0ABD5B992_ELIMR|nr:helix-turn-helix domain-containing protein [Elizabethkingia miricola]MDQ8749969.1 helix-turn-helix domain-containing protein [Elizabethkingia miricola]